MPFFCCSLMPLSLFPLSPISSPFLLKTFYPIIAYSSPYGPRPLHVRCMALAYKVFFPFTILPRMTKSPSPQNITEVKPVKDPSLFTGKGDPPKTTYESPLMTNSFFDKKFKPIGACSGYSIASLFLPGHSIPAPFFNYVSSRPGICFL